MYVVGNSGWDTMYKKSDFFSDMMRLNCTPNLRKEFKKIFIIDKLFIYLRKYDVFCIKIKLNFFFYSVSLGYYNTGDSGKKIRSI